MMSIHSAVKIKKLRTFKELIQESELCWSRNSIIGLQLKQNFKAKERDASNTVIRNS